MCNCWNDVSKTKSFTYNGYYEDRQFHLSDKTKVLGTFCISVFFVKRVVDM